LWAGLPVLSVRGKAFAGRMAASLLHAADLPELAVDSLPDYEARALALATDAAALHGMKARTRAAREGPLFDTARFTRDLEAAYGVMQQRALAGKAPVAFAIRRREDAQSR
ncbi:MAG: hypothetical protein ACKO4A_13775, partial [Gammaproteobacteria bacterium]